MMGLIGQGCEHGDVLEVTGTNTPTQKTPSVFHVWAIEKSSNAPRINVFAAKEKNDCCVCVCCTVFDATHRLHPIGCEGWLLFYGFVLVVLASRVRPVPFRSR